jgi:hypothetical protein
MIAMLALSMFATVSGVMAFFIWGAIETLRQGFPTVSRMLNDSENLSLFFLLVVLQFGFARAYVTLLYQRQPTLIHTAAVAGVLQVTGLVLVSFIRVDDNYNGHCAVTAIAIVGGLVRETLMLAFRIWRTTRSTMELCANIFFLVAMYAIAIAYFVLNITNDEDQYLAGLEYELVWLIPILYLFQLSDVATGACNPPQKGA